MFLQRMEEQPLWRLDVRIESPCDAQQLDWLVQCCGQSRVRAAARRRTASLAPRPLAVAAELGVELPAQLREQPAPAWAAMPPMRALQGAGLRPG